MFRLFSAMVRHLRSREFALATLNSVANPDISARGPRPARTDAIAPPATPPKAGTAAVPVPAATVATTTMPAMAAAMSTMTATMSTMATTMTTATMAATTCE